MPDIHLNNFLSFTNHKSNIAFMSNNISYSYLNKFSNSHNGDSFLGTVNRNSSKDINKFLADFEKRDNRFFDIQGWFNRFHTHGLSKEEDRGGYFCFGIRRCNTASKRKEFIKKYSDTQQFQDLVSQLCGNRVGFKSTKSIINQLVWKEERFKSGILKKYSLISILVNDKRNKLSIKSILQIEKQTVFKSYIQALFTKAGYGDFNDMTSEEIRSTMKSDSLKEVYGEQVLKELFAHKIIGELKLEKHNRGNFSLKISK